MDIYVRLVTADKCCCVSIQKQTLYYELCRYPDTTDTLSKYVVQKFKSMRIKRKYSLHERQMIQAGF